MMNLQACLEDLLIRGLDDWIQAAEVASVVRMMMGAESSQVIRELSLQLIQTLLEEGLVEIGTVEEGGFEPWGLPTEKAMRRIERHWSARPSGPGLGEVCWLNLTAKGQTLAEDLWARKKPEGS